MKINFIMFFIMIICITPCVFSGNYADLKIELSKDGFVTIDGVTNLPKYENIMNNPEYTSKRKEFWTFNFTTEEIFEDYIFELQMPEYAQINYVKGPANFRIEGEANQLKIIGFGENEPITLIVQYKLDFKNFTFIKNNIVSFLLGALIIVSMIVVILLIKLNKFKKKEKPKDTNTKEKQTYEINMTCYTPRQQEIIKILQKKKRMIQKELESLINIPKSSVSRNLRTLEIKGIIKKDRVGNTMYVSLIELEKN